MIRFDQGNRRFNYRVVGVAIHNDSVLLHRADHEPFWTLPGGRAEHGETAEQTIKRELLEELTTEVHVDRLLWVVENFFEYEGWSYHELALYFLVRFRPGSAPLCSEAFAESRLTEACAPRPRTELRPSPGYPDGWLPVPSEPREFREARAREV